MELKGTLRELPVQYFATRVCHTLQGCENNWVDLTSILKIKTPNKRENINFTEHSKVKYYFMKEKFRLHIYIICLYIHIWASLVAQTIKNLPANSGDPNLIPGSGRSPGKGNGYPLQSSCLENSRTEEPGGLYSPWDLKESDTTEWLTHTYTYMYRRV